MGEKRSFKNISNAENEFCEDIVFARFINYMNIALRHRALNYIRDKKRYEEREKRLNKKELELLSTKDSNSNSFFLFALKNTNIESNDIKNAINSLPSRQKNLIYLMFYENRSVKEISMKWDKSIYTIRQMKYRAIINIKKYLEK